MNIDKRVIEQMNECSKSGAQFLFVINFEMDEYLFYTNPSPSSGLYFNIGAVSNSNHQKLNHQNLSNDIVPIPIGLKEYKKKFEIVYNALHRGDSFLLNLTVATPIKTALSLEDIYHISKAHYKLYVPNRFVCFSPEKFVRIKDGKISSYPMKGTIDASLPNAKEQILADYKEQCEHNTIVDLIRNDLSQVAYNVSVKRFRYVERVGSVLQVSSEIEGELEDYYRENIGDTIMRLLPAGSISGAPKDSTIATIRRAEGERRGFYTGILAYYDGKNLDSGVLIRYIEQREDGLYFRSGGGITARANMQDEYEEVIQKIFIPQ